MMRSLFTGLQSLFYFGFDRQADLISQKTDGVKRIIAIGDSITEGFCSSDEKMKAYPVQLMNMLHDTSKYEVLNLGVGGRTMMKKGDYPYWNEAKYK